MNILNPPESYWNETVARTGLARERTDDEFLRLLRAYEEPHRHDHRARHLVDVLDVIGLHRHLATDLTSLMWAAWYHDAIYDPRATDNEERSADWAARSLRAWAVPEPCVARVVSLILETKHEGEAPQTPDTALFLDADLSILGSGPDRYDEYARAIRAEYDFVPPHAYRAGRGDILKKFLLRPRIFHTDLIHREKDEFARENLRREIDRLSP